MLCIGTPGHHPAGMSYRSPRGRGGRRCIAAQPRYPNANVRAGLVSFVNVADLPGWGLMGLDVEMLRVFSRIYWVSRADIYS